MRLISQHGNVDVPYDSVSLEHRNDEVVAITDQSTPFGVYEFTMGKYSSSEKAYKVMEMVREKYLQYIRVYGDYDSVENVLIEPKVFIFPKDEDVEV